MFVSLNPELKFWGKNATTTNLSTVTMANAATGKFLFSRSSASDVTGMMIDMPLNVSGNVGIGTTAPATKLHVDSAATATPNFPLFALGSGAFDGTTSGYFVGHASGTVIGVNAGSGYGGDFLNFQTAGVSKYKIDSAGNVVTGGTSTSTGNVSTSGNFATTGTGSITSAGPIYANSGAASTSTNTGAAIVSGGIGISGSQYLGGGFNMTGAGSHAQSFSGTSTAASIAANSLTSGSVLDLSSSSTAATTGSTGLNIAVSGANAGSSITRYGVKSSVTATGTSSVNVGGYFSATGGATNYGLLVPDGNVGIGESAPTTSLTVKSTATAVAAFNSTLATAGISVNGSSSTVGNQGIFVNGGDLMLYTGGTEKFRINSGTNLNASTLDASFKAVTLGSGASNLSLVNLDGQSNRQVGTSRNTDVNSVGRNFNIAVGGAKALSTDKAGGDLYLMSGTATGTGSSSLFLQTATAQGATSTSDNAPTTKMTILGNGNVGIGLSPGYKLDVAGDVNSSTCFRVGGTTVGGTCTSDIRLKENVQDFNLGLNDLLTVKLHTYTFNGLGEMPKTGEVAVGVIAQELERTHPSLVKTRMVAMHPGDLDKTEIKVVDYSKFSFMLINAVKDLYRNWFNDHKDLQKLKATVEAQDLENKKLKSELSQIKTYLCQQDAHSLLCQ